MHHLTKTALIFFLGCCTFPSLGQEKAFQLFTAKGKKTSFQKMNRAFQEADVVLFGEYHNNPIAHWMELEVLKSLAAEKEIVLGAEMFEADNQAGLTSYLHKELNTKQLDSAVRLWSNYWTDYAPLVDYAQAHELPFVATNIPRRYAKMVHKHGISSLDTLKDEEKSWLTPLPFPFDSTLSQYQGMLGMMGAHGSMDLVRAQAIKDATMAHFIAKNLPENGVFLHFNGSYHSDFHQGILWYLHQSKPELDAVTISTVSQEELDKLHPDHLKRADFILVVDEDMTMTY